MRPRRSALFAGCLLLWPIAAAAHEPGEGDDVALPDGASEAEASDTEVVVFGEDTTSSAPPKTHVGHRELELRPRRRPADVLEATPGLFVAQHAGGGKANQYFLRGFDADHGTDIAFYVDGVPANMVSHGHGQGYTDLNFVIPELVVRLDAHKGPYHARFGDFASAGAIELELASALPESYASFTAGQYGVMRGLVAASPEFADDWHAVLAAEVREQDGPFEHEEALRGFNTFARLTHHLDQRSNLTLSWLSYGSRWSASGQIPARAVCGEGEPGLAPPEAFGERCISRFGAVDPSEGGQTQRHALSMGYRSKSGPDGLSARAYAVSYKFKLFSNFTFFARDGLNGDGIEQTDDRTLLGADVGSSKTLRYGRSEFRTAFGIQSRLDVIDNALYDQRSRERLRRRNDASVAESAIALYVEEDARLTDQLRLLVGCRIQRVDVSVEDQLEDLERVGNRSSGSAGAMLLLPKFGAVVTPLSGWEIYGAAGRGFHSNDARGAVVRQAPADLMTAALGYELGTRLIPVRHVELYGAAFSAGPRLGAGMGRR